MHSGTGTTGIVRGAVAGANLLFTLAACTDDRAPTRPLDRAHADLAAAAGDTTTFYYYEHQPVHLTADPAAIVVVPANPQSATHESVSQAAGTLLAPLGLQIASVEPLGPPPTHWLLKLPGAVPAAATAARARLAADPGFRAVLPAYRTRDGNFPVYVLNRVIARFKAEISRAQVDSLANALGAVVVRPPVPDSAYVTYLLEPRPGAPTDALHVANAIDESPLATWASPDMIRHTDAPMSVPADPFFPLQYYLDNTATLNGVPLDIDVESAWDLTKGSSSIRVIFIDTGVERWHPEWHDRGSTMIGFDALWYLPGMEPNEWAGQPYSGTLEDEHGTAVAGIVLAAHDGVGTAGVAPNVVFDAVRIFRDTAHVATDNDIANGITWAAQHGDVLNNSWGGCSAQSQAVRDAITNAMSTGRGGKGAVVSSPRAITVPERGATRPRPGSRKSPV